MPLPLGAIGFTLGSALLGGAISAATSRHPQDQLRNFLTGSAIGALAGGTTATLGSKLASAVSKRGLGNILGSMYAGQDGKFALAIDAMQAVPSAYFALQDGKLDVGDVMSITSPFIGTAVGTALGGYRLSDEGKEFVAKKAAQKAVLPEGTYEENYDAIMDEFKRKVRRPQWRAKYKKHWEVDHHPAGLMTDIGLGWLSTLFHDKQDDYNSYSDYNPYLDYSVLYGRQR